MAVMKIWTFLLSLAVAGQFASAQAPVCESELDLVFVLDGSNSLLRSDWRRILQTVQTVVQQLPVSDAQIQIGVVEFATSVGDVIAITGNQAQLLNDIINLSKTDTGTGTHLAIERALQLLASSRPEAPDAIVFITDGATDYPDLTDQQVQIALSSNVPIYAIGVNDDIDITDLTRLAGGRADRARHASEIDQLMEALNNITATVCQQVVTTTTPAATTTTTTTTTTTPPPPPCEIQPTDIWFLVDQSTTVLGGPGAAFLPSALNSFVNTRELARYGASSDFRIGVITYSGAESVSSSLNSLKDTVLNVPDFSNTPTGLSNTYTGLERLLGMPASNSVKWIFVISGRGGQGTAATRAITAATTLRQNGYLISVLGVGAASNLNEAELRGIASENQYQRIDNYNQLSDTLYNFLRQRICNQVDNPCTKCVFDTMINIIPSPSTCTQFYQCLPNYSYIVKDCPMGTLFNDRPGHRTCEFMHDYSCPSWGQCGTGPVRRFQAMCCGEYYECDNGVVRHLTCPVDRPIFSVAAGDCVVNNNNDQCVNDVVYCRSAFSRRELDTTLCDNYRPVQNDVCKYEQRQTTGDNIWQLVPCALGTGWNQTKCTCDHNPACMPTIPSAPTARDNEACESKIHVTFSSTGVTVMDDTTKAVRGTSVQKNKVSFSGRSAVFNGNRGQDNDILYIPFFSNFWWFDSFGFKVTFRLAENAQQNMDYDIWANDRCGQCDPSLYMKARRGVGNERTVTFRVTDDSNTVLELTGSVNVQQATDWLEVGVSVEKQVVTATIHVLNDAGNRINVDTTLTPSTAVTRLTSRVKSVICGLGIGQGPVNALVGDIQDFQYMQCDRPSRRLL